MPFDWTLKAFLDENRITVNRLAQEVDEKLSRTSVYKTVDNPGAAKVSSLETIIDGVSVILRRPVALEEIATYAAPEQH